MQSNKYYDYRVFEPQIPRLDAGREKKRHEVMICGGGPVGLALALALAKYGVASVVIDADQTVCQGSRATCLSRRTLEILDRLGVLGAFEETSLGWTTGRSFYKNTEVLRFDMPHGPDDRLLPMFNIQQYYVEQFLVDEIEKYPDLIEIRWGTSVERVTDDGNGVDVQLNAAGESYRSNAKWLVACDGARSKVRQELGLRLNGTAYEGRYVIVDVNIDLDWPTGRLAWFNPSSNPGRTMLMHRQPDKIWRIDYRVEDGEDAEEMTKPENVIPVVESHFKMLGVDLPWQIVWSSTYRASALSLDEYVHGNVIFAGDAAHLVPIFGVRGLNSGFEDAFNLGWKLAYIVKGVAPPALLKSYHQERRGAWCTNVAHAMKSTEFMAPTSRGFQLMRDAALSLAERHAELRTLINPRQSSVIPYEGSPLNVHGNDEKSFVSPIGPGVAVPEFRVRTITDDSFLTRHLENRFNLLLFAPPDVPLNDTIIEAKNLLRASASDLKVIVVCANAAPQPLSGSDLEILVDSDGRCRRAFDAEKGAAYLVRPDGYICARWRKVDRHSLNAALHLATASSVAVENARVAV